MQKFRLQKKYRHLVFAYPINQHSPDLFPASALPYLDNPFGLHLRPNREADSSRLQLCPVLGPTEPLFFRGVGEIEAFHGQELEGWRFVGLPNEFHYQHLNNDNELDEVMESAAWRFACGIKTPGTKDVNYKYAHFARLDGPSLLIDMMRYDNFAPATKVDAEELIDSQQNRRNVKELYVVQLGETSKPHWTTERHYNGMNLMPMTYNEVLHKRGDCL